MYLKWPMQGGMHSAKAILSKHTEIEEGVGKGKKRKPSKWKQVAVCRSAVQQAIGICKPYAFRLHQS
jgi:hypothetical protein